MVGQIMGLNDSKLKTPAHRSGCHLEFWSLQKNATVVISDSGGIYVALGTSIGILVDN